MFFVDLKSAFLSIGAESSSELSSKAASSALSFDLGDNRGEPGWDASLAGEGERVAEAIVATFLRENDTNWQISISRDHYFIGVM